MSLVVLPDKSIINDQAKVIFFSLERFRTDIVEGHCCFICGARPDANAFNDEHVVPRWILKRFDLLQDTGSAERLHDEVQLDDRTLLC